MYLKIVNELLLLSFQQVLHVLVIIHKLLKLCQLQPTALLKTLKKACVSISSSATIEAIYVPSFILMPLAYTNVFRRDGARVFW
jgi:hypothetical protein